MKDRSHEGAMAEIFAEDPNFGIQYLNTMLEDGDLGDFLTALRQMATAHGSVSSIADRAGLDPIELCRILASDGNPEVRGLIAVLRALGMRLTVTNR